MAAVYRGSPDGLPAEALLKWYFFKGQGLDKRFIGSECRALIWHAEGISILLPCEIPAFCPRHIVINNVLMYDRQAARIC